MMNGRHLPAGQGMQQDMGRRRSYNHQQYQHVAPVYNSYMNPYNNFYPQVPAQYQQGGIPPAQYPPYSSYGRSPPPAYQQFANTPPPVVSAYSRPQHSPAVVSTPYQLPLAPYQPPPSLTSTPSQSPSTIPAPPTQSTPKPPPGRTIEQVAVERVIVDRIPFQPPIPWYSRPDLPWPTRSPRLRKARKMPSISAEAVELPIIQPTQNSPTVAETSESASSVQLRPETPSTTEPPSEQAMSTTPTTPSSLQHPSSLPAVSVTPSSAKIPPRHAAAVPILPAVPKPVSRASSGALTTDHKVADAPEVPPVADDTILQIEASDLDTTNHVEESEAKSTSPPLKGPPKLWTGLFKAPTPIPTITANGAQPNPSTPVLTSSFNKTNSESLADALHAFSAGTRDAKLAFLKPRGLVNTGNMCYMNSVLQVLIFCIPFYNFLDQVGKKAAHSFKSDTPLIDAMIMFMREFPVIDSAISPDQLCMRLRENELEQYGEPFTPDFVYDVIRRLPRFSTMRRGHQQDAEEFLGFLLEGLHDECVQVMQSSGSSAGTSTMATPTNVPSSPVSDAASVVESASGEAANGWLEVGPKQKAAITRSSGTILLESPVTKIFGGTLRSELRVPGLKNSVTMEPYQPLQLDIGSPRVNNIIDALKGLTRPEALHGDFNSPRGPNVTATKQVLIETLPPVLILHLKRFQYDNTGGTQKIWKKIGYPLELEIPKEVFSRQKHGSMLNHGGLPKYRLMAVVYHHGKNASGGHYTVDVRRQDGREWIRLDDTVMRRVKSEDVAEGGSEEDPKVIAAALEAHNDSLSSGNIFAQMKLDEDEETGTEEEWKQVNGPSTSSNGGSGKKWSNVVNGTATKTKNGKSSIKDNKVAYLLFYQMIAS